MDFALSEEQQAIFDMAYAFGQDEIAPHAREWEAAGTIPKEIWRKLAELGLGGIYVREEFGGSGLSRLDATLIFEALAMACPAVGSFLSIHNMVAAMIDKFGSAAMQEKWLPALCRMEKIASYCLTEPGSGSDAAALRTRAEAMYVGMAEGVDALVPFVEHQEIMTDWDARRGIYKLEPLQDFMPEVHRRLAQKGLSRNDGVILICRSGDRSSRAANRLTDEGYTQVWSVVDGFEGDMSQEGRRTVNGWKNAGLPWSYKLDQARMYFPR